MRTDALIRSTLTLVLAAAATLAAQTFDIKPGEWQMTVVMDGTMGDSSALPPAARAKLLEEMKKPHTVTDCITAEDIADVNLGKYDDDDDEQCRVTSKKFTAGSADVVRTCTGDEARTETMHIVATSREAFHATSKIVGPDRNATVTMDGKWIGSTCKDK